MTARAGASAPGKLVIAGEYAVLGGAACLVAAVDRRAVVRIETGSAARADGSPPLPAGSPERPGIPPEVRLARTTAEETCGVIPGEMHLDVSALRQGGRKLGLGSSAAGAAAAAGAVFAACGREVTDPAVRAQILDAALAGHRAVAPGGSGADVAASVLGGWVRFRLGGERGWQAERVPWPEGLEVRVAWTGGEARTSDLVRAVEALRDRDAGGHGRRMEAVAEAAAALIRAVDERRPGDVIAAARAHHEALRALGEAAGVAIVEERLDRVAALAAEAGGAAKPSGAGGGDVAVAFFESAEAAGRFEARCREAGVDLLRLGLGAEGVTALEGD